MGRHSSAQAEEKQPQRRTVKDWVRPLWQLLPVKFRRRMWHRRQIWRSWWDHHYTPKGDWDAGLPKDAANWTDELNWGSVGVAATLRTTFRRRGDLLPDHHHTQEQS